MRYMHAQMEMEMVDCLGALFMTCASLLRDVKKSFGLELRLVKDRSSKSECEIKSRSIDAQFTNCIADFDSIKARAEFREKQSLFQKEGGGRAGYTTEGKDNDQLLNEASVIQDNTMQSLGRSKALIEASKDIGTATLEVLVNQREQINDVTDDVDVIESNLVRAEKLMTSFSRRMASDRVLQFFTFVNCILIVAIVVYVVTHKRQLNIDGERRGESKT